MKSTLLYIPFAIGFLLLIYVFTIGQIWNNHSVQNYMLLCTGILSINLGLLGMAIAPNKRSLF